MISPGSAIPGSIDQWLVALSILLVAGLAAYTALHIAARVAAGKGLSRRVAPKTLQLQITEDRYRLLFENCPAGVCRATLDGRLLDCNEAYSRTFGFESHEQCLAQKATHLDLAAWQDLSGQLREKKSILKTERSCSTRDGRLIWIIEGATLVEGRDGTPPEIEFAVTDITDRKRAEESQLEAQGGLDSRVRERTAELDILNENLLHETHELKSAREQALPTEGQFRLLLDTIPAMVWTATPEGMPDYVNQHWRDYVGRDLEDAVGWNWKQYNHPEDIPRVVERWRESLASGSPFEIEGRLRRADGTYRWFLRRAVPLRDEKGNILKWYGTTIDIDDRKRAEEALQESEEKYRHLFSQASDAILILDMESHRFFDANGAAARLYGYAHEELLGMRPEELSAEPERTTAAIRELEQTGSVRVPVRWHRKKDGTVFPVEVSGWPFPWKNRRVSCVFMHDIAERKRAEAALMEERHLLRTLMDNLPDYIYFKDRESRFIRTNKAHAKAFGLSDPAQAVGKTDYDFFTHEHAQQAYTDEQEITRTGQPMLDREEKETWPDGRETWVSTTKMPLLDASGHVIGTFGISRDITERKRAEEALRETQQRLELAARASNTGLWDWDLQTNTVYYSPEWKSQIGCSADEISNSFEEWEKRVHPEDLPSAMGHIRKYMENPQGEFRNEFRFQHKDGSYRWILAQASVLQDEQGKPYRMLGSHLDITERKRAEEALRESEERFQLVARATNDLVWDWNLGTNELRWNEGVSSILGYRREQVGGDINWWYEHIHPEDHERVVSGIHAAIESGAQVWSDEYRYRRADGSYGYFFDRGYVIYEDTGKAVRMIGAMLDLSERKRAEEALLASEERLRLAVDAAAQQVWDWDLERDEITWSGFDFEALLGYPPGTFGRRQESFLALVHPEDRESVERSVNRAWAGGPEYDIEFRYVRADGTPCWVTTRGKTIRDAHGKPIRMIGVARDISQSKQAEEALRESEERYRSLVARNLAGIGVTSLDGRILDCNEAYARIFGYASREELMSRPVPGLWFDAAERAEFVARLQREWILTNVELRLRGKEDQPVWVLSNVSLVEQGEGQDAILEATIVDITQRKRAEEALRERENLLRTIIESEPECVKLMNLDGELIQMNSAGLAMIEADSFEQVKGRCVYPNVAPEQRAMYQKLTEAVFQGKGGKLEFEFVGLRGGRRWLETTEVPLLDGTGKVTAALGITRDITERKRAEETLQKSEKKYQELVNTIQEGIWVIDKESFTTFVNPCMAEMLDYKVDEMQGRDLFSFMDQSGVEIAKRNLERRRQGIQELHEFELLTKAGRRVHTTMNTAPILDDGGNYAGAIAAVVDITVRKQAEERFTKAFNASPEPITISEISDGTYIDVNDAFLRITGYQREEVIGRSALDLKFWPTPEARTQLLKAIERGSVREFEASFTTKSGDVRVGQLSAEVIEVGGRRCLLGVTQDVTDRKQAEKALQQSLGRMRALAAHLQKVREEERTRIARELHDELGQAMTAIKFDLTSLIRNPPANHEQMAGRVEPVIRVLDETIQSVRRISTKLRPSILENMGLAAGLEWAGEEFETRTGMECRVSAQEIEDIDHGRAIQLFRIAQEALTNIARHAHATHVRMRLAMQDGNLMLEIHDDGTGIHPEQIESTTSLGLLGMRERTLALGGDFQISGSPGIGTTVKVCIRVEQAPTSR